MIEHVKALLELVVEKGSEENDIPIIMDINNLTPFKMMHACVYSLLTICQN